MRYTLKHMGIKDRPLQLRKIVGREVKLRRVGRGWSQETLAELSGLNRSYIGATERGQHNIGVDNIQKIATALEVPAFRLLQGPEF